eukprot:CAMPEP_0168749738 /NCGR_PEP_ID=MMETSP0724-20121128/16878_1 /TAXON_ID=265536 /ORGANISM="Amphiprora sp., Strain CCMP467" /LENGTH=506 /DNA_ID=CAMNT_0008797671 /DNA_START=141 /DNA_END=1657 /DNA_ORIENTATION=+
MTIVQQVRPVTGLLLPRRSFSTWTLKKRDFSLFAASKETPKNSRPYSFYFADWVDNDKAQDTLGSQMIRTLSSQTESTTPIDSEPVRPFRILFLGTPEVAAETLQTLHEASRQSLLEEDTATPKLPPFEIAGVVTQPPRPRNKRSKKLVQSPVGQLALDLDLPLLTPQKANSKRFLDQLAELPKEEDGDDESATTATNNNNNNSTDVDIYPHGLAPIDLCITAAYGQYLPKRFLATPALGTVNIHPSLLPKWRGASPVQRSLQAGDNPIGVTVLYTVSAMDAGPIIAQEEYTLDDENDEEETKSATFLLPTLFQKGTQLLLEKLSDILAGKITMDTAQAQTEDDATAATLIHSTEGQLRPWDETAEQCIYKYRGFSMWPQTYMYIQVVANDDDSNDDGDDDDTELPVIKVKITQARVLRNDNGTLVKQEPTQTLQMGPNKKNDGLRVTCFDGSVLEVLKVQPAGRPKPFAARDLQNGYPKATLQWHVQDDMATLDHVPAGTEKRKR